MKWFRSSVSVTVGETTETISYKKGGWGGWGDDDEDEDDDGPVSYTVSIGTSTDDSLPFIGTIQNFIIDGRFVFKLMLNLYLFDSK